MKKEKSTKIFGGDQTSIEAVLRLSGRGEILHEVGPLLEHFLDSLDCRLELIHGQLAALSRSENEAYNVFAISIVKYKTGNVITDDAGPL